MAITLTLSLDDAGQIVAECEGETLAGQIVAECEGETLAGPTAPETLPTISAASNPYRLDPRGLGAKLYAAMGGEALWQRLAADPERLLLLRTAEATAAWPWEYAFAPDHTSFLAVKVGFLRLLDEAPAAPPAEAGPLQLLLVAAEHAARFARLLG